MADLPKPPQAGQRVLDWLLDHLMPWLAMSRLVAGRGITLSRSTGGTLIGATGSWAGLVVVAGHRWRDEDLLDDLSGSDSVITDNSTAEAKTWIKVVVTPGAEAVTYEDSPVFVAGNYPPDTEYYERALQAGPIHVTRFG
jgi:hypothetical protein